MKIGLQRLIYNNNKTIYFYYCRKHNFPLISILSIIIQLEHKIITKQSFYSEF